MSREVPTKSTLRLPTLERAVTGLIGLVLVVIVLKQLAVVIQPLFVAIFFSYLGSPIARRLVTWKVPAVLARLAIVPIALAMFALLGWIIFAHVDNLQDALPEYQRQIREMLAPSVDRLIERLPGEHEQTRTWLLSALTGESLTQFVRSSIGNFVGGFSLGFLSLVYLVFLSLEAAGFPRRLEAAFGPERASHFMELGERTNRAIIRYLYVKSIASVLVASFSTAAMLFFDLDLALLWGALIFFANFIPYVGSAVAVVFPITIGILQFDSAAPMIALAAILIGLQVLIGSFLDPHFAGRELNLSPLVVVLSLAFWGWVWGPIGMLLSIPIMVGLKLIMENVPTTQSAAALMTGRPREPGDEEAGLDG